MQKFLIGLSITVALVGTPAIAADMPVKAPPPVPTPVYSWTGFYVGGNAGYDWGNNNVTYDPPGPPNGFNVAPINDVAIFGAGATQNVSNRGFTGGGQAGYNYQFNRYVAGLEADIEYLQRSGQFSGMFVGAWGTQNVNISGNSGWLATVRGRLGITFDRYLVYGTGGVAFTNADVNIGNNWNPALGVRDASVNLNNTRTGWVAGGGVEYAFPQNWSLRAEYLYVKFDDSATTFTAGMLNPAATVSHFYTVNMVTNIVRAGLNYQFH